MSQIVAVHCLYVVDMIMVCGIAFRWYSGCC